MRHAIQGIVVDMYGSFVCTRQPAILTAAPTCERPEGSVSSSACIRVRTRRPCVERLPGARRWDDLRVSQSLVKVCASSKANTLF